MSVIEFEWNEHFKPHILARGKKYFEEDCVSNIRHIQNTYIAAVKGTYEYEVEITIEDGVITEMACNCPYGESNNCKHMAAVLCALETENVVIEELSVAPKPPVVSHVPMELPWLEAIENLPEETIRKELLKRADREYWLKERLAVLYLGKLPEGQLQNWKADLQEIASFYVNRKGWISVEDAEEFIDNLDDFLDEHLPLLFEVKAAMAAFHLLWIVMEAVLEWYVDNAYDSVDALLKDCEESLRKLYSIATDEQREQMLQWYQEHRNPEWPGGVERMDRIFRLLILINSSIQSNRKVKFLKQIPYFLYQDEWVPFPQHGDMQLYYDFVEETAEYKEVEPVVEAIIKEKLGQCYYGRGSSYRIYPQRKKLLKELYGIEWYSPIELNPGLDFD